MNTAGNRFSIGESGAVIDIELMELLERNGKRMIQLKDNSTCNNNNVSNHKDFKPREGHQLVFNDTFNQHKRKKTAQHVSSFAMATIVFLWIVLDICSQLSMTPEHGPIVIWSHLLGLLGFMVFVWAVAIMILVGVQLSRMQCAMLVFWAILMLVRSFVNALPSVQCCDVLSLSLTLQSVFVFGSIIISPRDTVPDKRSYVLS
ncbi:hypothetical protein RJT34_18158 [Clitoria ternatea]|uniref:Uncharacterized protein n=1 Tax=Clitoria ternatea TaxID=43366 RepID=A0AAN9JAT7_CLITE